MTYMIADTTSEAGLPSALLDLNVALPSIQIEYVLRFGDGGGTIETVQMATFLEGSDYPALVAVWDNEADDIFDQL